ncbi:PREDICTED: C-X-C motif chemokine 13, partial [Hipposideros armiger]|uniref:C-X-C motif chemokine 13 n=1 Tax=Hipposideros armiger TaxID=186990 RepID=A0A8B7QJY0_HIPAR
SPVHGILEAFNTSLKCRCSRTLSTLPNAYRRIVRIEITAPGNGCPNQEIIVRLKNKSAICLNPNSKWTRKFLSELWKKRLPIEIQRAAWETHGTSSAYQETEGST